MVVADFDQSTPTPEIIADVLKKIAELSGVCACDRRAPELGDTRTQHSTHSLGSRRGF